MRPLPLLATRGRRAKCKAEAGSGWRRRGKFKFQPQTSPRFSAGHAAVTLTTLFLCFQTNSGKFEIRRRSYLCLHRFKKRRITILVILMHLQRLLCRKKENPSAWRGHPVLQLSQSFDSTFVFMYPQFCVFFPPREGVKRMPMQRTEIHGAEELHKYYKVYETIGSGTVQSSSTFPFIPRLCSFSY